jgi:hypothetical protein
MKRSPQPHRPDDERESDRGYSEYGEDAAQHTPIEVASRLPSIAGVATFVGKHPITAACAALAAGFVVGRLFSRM